MYMTQTLSHDMISPTRTDMIKGCIMHNANDAKTFLKHFSYCLFYFCSTCADSIKRLMMTMCKIAVRVRVRHHQHTRLTATFAASVNVITHADNSRGSKAFSGVCLCVCVCVCPHDRTKTAETTITKLATGIVHQSPRPPINIRSKGVNVVEDG